MTFGTAEPVPVDAALRLAPAALTLDAWAFALDVLVPEPAIDEPAAAFEPATTPAGTAAEDPAVDPELEPEPAFAPLFRF